MMLSTRLCQVTSDQDLLLAYDAQLRTDAETPGATAVSRLGPLRLVTFAGGRGFITYQSLEGAREPEVRRLVGEAKAFFESDPSYGQVEWKTRGHDQAPGLECALRDFGFIPDEPESIMIGEARLLAEDVAVPEGVSLRTVSQESDVRAMEAMQNAVFGGPSHVEALLSRLARQDTGMELWVAEVAGQIVSAGRLELVEGTDFAGIWGGATLPQWRGRGIYRALTAARARSAIKAGKTLINSDSTEFSRPILERSGLRKVSTTTPYLWRRPSRT